MPTKNIEAEIEKLLETLSSITMTQSNLLREEKAFINKLKRQKKQLQQETDYQNPIEPLEIELAHEMKLEQTHIENISEKNNTLQNRSFLKDLQQEIRQEYQQEIILHEQKCKDLLAANTRIEAELQDKQKIHEELKQNNQKLESQIELFQQEINQYQQELKLSLQSHTFKSFSQFNQYELEYLYLNTAQPELFYAVSLRLGITQYLQSKHLSAFRFLSYLPKSLLEKYGVDELFEQIKQIVHVSVGCPYSYQFYLQTGIFKKDKLEKEVLFLLSIQASQDHQENNFAAYHSLLSYHLHHQSWLLAYLIIEKIRDLSPKTSKSDFPLGLIQDQFSRAAATPPEQPKHYLKYHQMLSIMAKIPELKDVPTTLSLSQILDTIQNNPSLFILIDRLVIEVEHRNLKLVSTKSQNLFISNWVEFQNSLYLIQEGRWEEARNLLSDILQSNLYFIEAYQKMEECLNEPYWQHLSNARI